MPDGALYGAVEAGGTKFVCGVGDAAEGSRETATISTADPETTLAAVQVFFRDAECRHGRIAALGIGSFGPLELDSSGARYGFITSTPKLGWANADILGRLTRGLGVPGAIDTDVNAAAMAEASIRPAAGDAPLAYITVGTGIGVGLLVNGKTVQGHGHPELGHLSLRKRPEHDHFAGVCPYHGDCLEGVASGPAIFATWGVPLSDLPAGHPALEVEADYLGQLCALLILTFAPECIVLGGGVMSQRLLYPAVHRRTAHWLAGYLPAYAAEGRLSQVIVPPRCREPSGLVGAYLLAERLQAGMD